MRNITIAHGYVLLLLLLVATVTNAFVSQERPLRQRLPSRAGTQASLARATTSFRLSSSSSGGKDNNNDDTTTRPMSPTEIIIEKRMNPNFVPPGEQPSSSSSMEMEQESKRYPLEIPSPVLLATSILLAIVSTGSIYQWANHQTTQGDLTPVAIALVGFPTCIFLFYAAITKAMVETEEDDKKFLSGQ